MRRSRLFTFQHVAYVLNQPPERPHPGDMVLITANFLDDRSNYGIVIRQYSPQVNPGYEVLIGGKKKYFPPHLIKIVARRESAK
jgi:hypothetical protein